MICDSCWLLQTQDYAHPDELFSPDYAYFSSTSSSWLSHAARYVDQMMESLELNHESLVIEIASNDGYLLKNFVTAGIPCLGIEPTISTAEAAEKLGIPVLREFFCDELGKRLAREGRQANLIVGNNVYAHVPDINDFTQGLKAALKLGGTITLEFPHLMRLVEHAQFDTVYHEHFSYLSLYTASRIFETANLRIYDVKELATHGGSLRLYGCHLDDPRETKESVEVILKEEKKNGLQHLKTYIDFQPRVEKIKEDLLAFLIEKNREGKKVAAYGAAAKGNTLLNFAGVKPNLLPFVCDAAVAKQGLFMPGSHIPIYDPERIREEQPDFVLILPWNISEEVQHQYEHLREKGVQFVTVVPELKID